MLKFMRHQQKLSPERLQKQKELFSYTKACQHGFPTKPSALAWDDQLKLLALATHSGGITIYGSPGVEYYGQHDSHDHTVTTLCFVPGKGQLISLCDDNSLHQWQVQSNTNQLKLLRSVTLEGKLKRVSVLCCNAESNTLLVGTEGGNIYLCNLSSFNISDNIIYQDVVMQNVAEEYKVNPGAVECLQLHPLHPGRVLIGYQRGLCVLWDMAALTALQTYVGNQQLESISWHPSGTKFIASHNDGSVTIWPSELPSSEEVKNQPEALDGPNTIYGPFPCKPITGVSWCNATSSSHREASLLVFGGGMQRASHGDRNTVTAMHYDGGTEADTSFDQHVTFNLSSRIIDFLVIQEKEGEECKEVAGCLVILCEEEIVFIDLITPEWPTMTQPYLCSLHCSAITCTAYVSDPLPSVYAKILAAGAAAKKSSSAVVSERPVPIIGGTADPKTCPSPDTAQDLLITGHEDGSVRIWCCGGVCLSLLHTITTSALFESDDPPADNGAGAEDDDWPPFRKTGLYDPYSDDPRLAVKKLQMCGLSGMLVVAGTAGQVIVFQFTDADVGPAKLQAVSVDLVAETENFVWKSHSKLELKGDEEVSAGAGVEVQLLLQLHPPASCTALHLHSEWGLLACGTAHGFCLADVVTKKNLHTRGTLSMLDMANAADEGPMSRRKSLKKSLRESFRRLRKGRSQRKTTQVATQSKPSAPVARSTNNAAALESAADAVRPVERAIESRQHASDYLGSMVRCLCLTRCFIANNMVMSATLWAGTNSGNIYVLTIAIPPSDKRKDTPITVQLGKEIRLKHAAPVLGITVLDAQSKPFPPPLALKKDLAPAPDSSGPHKVLICSEEQFKVFTLPQLKPFIKYKLTALDGSRVRKIGFGEFASSVDPSYKECCFTVVTNQGDASVFSLPDCRKQLDAACFKKEDINGINSVVFSHKGEALFLTSPSELMRVSFSAQHTMQPRPSLALSSPNKAATPTPAPPPPAPAQEQPPPQDAEQTEEPSNEESCKDTKEESGAKEEVEGGEEEGSITVEVSGPPAPKKLEDVNGAGDTSVLSGDITIDSIRDHMVIGSNTTLASNTTIGSSNSTTVHVTSSTSSTTTSVTTKQLTVIKTATTSSSSTSATTEEQQPVATADGEENTSAPAGAVNGTEASA